MTDTLSTFEAIPPGTRFADLPSPFAFRRGGELRGARMAFETWGRLNAARDNAVLILNYKDGVAILEASWDLPPAQRLGNEIYGL